MGWERATLTVVKEDSTNSPVLSPVCGTGRGNSMSEELGEVTFLEHRKELCWRVLVVQTGMSPNSAILSAPEQQQCIFQAVWVQTTEREEVFWIRTCRPRAPGWSEWLFLLHWAYLAGVAGEEWRNANTELFLGCSVS